MPFDRDTSAISDPDVGDPLSSAWGRQLNENMAVVGGGVEDWVPTFSTTPTDSVLPYKAAESFFKYHELGSEVRIWYRVAWDPNDPSWDLFAGFGTFRMSVPTTISHITVYSPAGMMTRANGDRFQMSHAASSSLDLIQIQHPTAQATYGEDGRMHITNNLTGFGGAYIDGDVVSGHILYYK